MEENNLSSPYSTPGEEGVTPESRLRVTSQMKASLLSSMKWLQFLLIICCIGLGLLLLLAIAMIIFSSAFPTIDNELSPAVTLGMGMLYLFIAALYVYPIVKGFHLVEHTRKALRAGTTSDLEASADNFHAIMKFCGILTIIGIALYVIFIVAIILIAIFTAK
ncbi:MAG: hypothetical protein IKX59_04125 [Bacteroidales bacterium]|nr:hypothetical protein [Bacteroidales bacterium]